MGGAKAPQRGDRGDPDGADFRVPPGVFWAACLPVTLKAGHGGADKRGMFVPSKEPIFLSEACLLGLCASLNAPVVQNDELAPGPARAAIVTFAEEYGDLSLAVAIRCLETGNVVVYRCRESLVDAKDVARAMETALVFAEGLGFLFDDDMIDGASGAGRSEALEHWNRLTGEGEVFPTTGVVEPPAPPVAEITLPGEGLDAPMEDLLATDSSGGVDPDADPNELSAALLLDDLMDGVGDDLGEELLLESAPQLKPDLKPEPPVVAEPEPAAPSMTMTAPPAPPAARAGLSKFRRPADDGEALPARRKRRTRQSQAGRAAAEPLAEATRPDFEEPEPDPVEAVEVAPVPVDGPAALGRIPIVRRRRREPESSRPSLLARILASF
jgi:hypothetical protein